MMVTANSVDGFNLKAIPSPHLSMWGFRTVAVFSCDQSDEEKFFVADAGNGKGLGVFATESIEQGTFLGIYQGVRLSQKQMGKKYPKLDAEYCFCIDQEGNVVDGASSNHWTKFMNHACCSNCSRSQLKSHRYSFIGHR